MQGIERRFCGAWGLALGFVILHRLSSLRWFGVAPLLFAGVWAGLILFIRYFLPQVFLPGQTRRMREVNKGHAFMAAVFCIAVQYVIGAVINSLTASPYDTSPSGILLNILRVAPFLAAREIVRAYGIGAFCFHKRKVLWAALLTGLLFACELNFNKLLHLTGFQAGFIYLAETVLPLLALHVLLTVLVFLGGVGAGIIYAGVIEVVPFLIPILPSLPWIAKSAVGICFPLGLLLLSNDWGHRDAPSKKEGNQAGFLATLLASVAFLWFCVGVFPVYPSVVLTGSMEPHIRPGDVVLIEKITEEKALYHLSEGDIINFKRDRITITHRIVAIVQDEAGNLSFQTKGDNNDAPDVQPVLPNDINGLVSHTVPKVGLPILVLRSGAEGPEGVVDDEN